jgi:hypothetical protein
MQMTKKMMMMGLLCFANSVSAFELSNEIDFLTGWRSDKIFTNLKIYDVKGGELVQQENDHTRDLDSWQFGFRGVFALPSWHNNCYCDGYVDPNNLYIRASAMWGWGTGGPYKQVFSVSDVGTRCAKARNVSTQDYDVALGWFIPFSCNIGMAPVVGFNYDRLEYKARHFPRDYSDANGTRITSTYLGPYVGVDLAWNWCDWLLAAGYEYEWVTRWRSNYLVPGDFLDTLNYVTDYKRSHCGWGNIAHVDLIYSWYCWDIGVNFKYRYFQAKHGRDKVPAFTEVAGASLDAPPYSKTSGNWWNYQVNLVIGTRF